MEKNKKPKFTYYHKMIMASFVMSIITGILGILTTLFIGLEKLYQGNGDPIAFVTLLSASLITWIVLACISANKTKDNKMLKLSLYIASGVMILPTITTFVCAYAKKLTISTISSIMIVSLILYLGVFIYISIITLLQIKKLNKQYNIKK